MEKGQSMGAPGSARATGRYDRGNGEVTLGVVEGISIGAPCASCHGQTASRFPTVTRRSGRRGIVT